MSVKNIACAITQGGHSPSYNFRMRQCNRRERQEAKRFINMIGRDEESDAVMMLEHRYWGYRRDASTGRLSAFTRWIHTQIGRTFDEVNHDLAQLDRRWKVRQSFRERIVNSLRHIWDDTQWVQVDDVVVDDRGTLCRGSEVESLPRKVRRPAPANLWDIEDAAGTVVESCGELYWKHAGRLVSFTPEETERFYALPGYQQRTLKAYHRPLGKRRKNRPLTKHST